MTTDHHSCNSRCTISGIPACFYAPLGSRQQSFFVRLTVSALGYTALHPCTPTLIDTLALLL